ncbi:hypothetical protein V5O48_016599 [Marasmius crinis-equi]|uniref:DUF7918 domain-containing protein n=1 Tax=Marasmius crinis-equi TaxID=585013 RepID=A0ABR3ER88_9AGAR
MITVNNYSAWITIGDKACEEYEVDVSEEAKTVTCWIASEVGKEYEVNWECNNFTGPYNTIVRIDGNPCGGMLSRSAITGPGRKLGIRTSPTTLNRFSFSSVNTTDDNAFISTPDSPEMGDIKITIKNTKVLAPKSDNWSVAPVEKTFHETAKKCINHQTRFQPTTTAATDLIRVEDFGEPLATFCFKYRPLGILQANGIASPPAPQRTSPSPPPQPGPTDSRRSSSGSKRGLEDDDEDVKPDVLDLSDGDEDDAKLRDLKNQIAAFEARKKQKGQPPRKKIKREPIVGLTIDLTDD